MDPTIHGTTDPGEVADHPGDVPDYADSLGFDFVFQRFDRELAGFPGPYAPPSGCVLLARMDGRPAYCVALKPVAGGICEMKG